MKSKARMIKEANNKLDNPTNRQIKKHIKDNAGLEVTSQEIYSCIGAEKCRSNTKLTPAQLTDTKKLIRQTYNGNFKQAREAITIIGDIQNAKY